MKHWPVFPILLNYFHDFWGGFIPSQFVFREILGTIQGDRQDGDHSPKTLWMWCPSTEDKGQKMTLGRGWLQPRLGLQGEQMRGPGRRQGFTGETCWRPFCSLLYDHRPPLSGPREFFMPKTSAIPSPSLLTQPQILAVWFHSVMPWVLWQGPRQCAFKVFLPPGHYYICHPFNSLSPFSLNTVKKGAYRLFQTNAFNPGTSLLELSANCGIQTVPPNYLKSFRVALGEHWRFNFVGWFVVLVFSNLHLSH